MRKLPIRLRLATAFAVAMAIVLLGAGVLTYERVGNDLSRSLDQDLRLTAQDLSALVRDPRSSLGADTGNRLIERGESFAQLLDHGRVLGETPTLGSVSLLSEPQIARALQRTRFFDRSAVPGLDEPARLLAAPVRRGGRRVVLVV